jgi:long-subunit acyl-CoA synthetase (AMP-forming)
MNGKGYGMTETSSVLTCSTGDYNKPGSVGRMLTGITAKVVDENGKGIAYNCNFV